MHTPTSLMQNYPDELLTIADRTVCRKKRDLDEEELWHYKGAWMRYEPQRKMLYIKAKNYRELIAFDSKYSALLASGQYVGSFTYAFYGHTPFNGPNCEVFAFDLTRAEDDAVVIPEYVRKQKYKLYEKRYGRGSKQVTDAMRKWEVRYMTKMRRDGNIAIETQTDVEITIAKLQERLRTLTAKVSGKRAPIRKPKPTQPLPELDAFIKDNNQHIRRKLTRRVVIDGVPTLQTKTYDPYEHGLETIGLYTDITDIQGRRSTALALQVAALKLTVPNFKEDVRKTKAQSVRIHSQKHQGCVYCAVFDMRKEPHTV